MCIGLSFSIPRMATAAGRGTVFPMNQPDDQPALVAGFVAAVSTTTSISLQAVHQALDLHARLHLYELMREVSIVLILAQPTDSSLHAAWPSGLRLRVLG